MPLENLTRTRIVEALNLLGDLADEAGVELDICIFGGTAMMLAFDARERTKDVDAIIRPAEIGKQLAAKAASRLNLDESWINDGVKQFISVNGTFAPLRVEELELAAKKRLKITRPSASYLLAMKALACRPPLPGYSGDVGDIAFLIRKMNIRTLEEIDEHIERFYPTEALNPSARKLIQELLSQDGREQK